MKGDKLKGFKSDGINRWKDSNMKGFKYEKFKSDSNPKGFKIWKDLNLKRFKIDGIQIWMNYNLKGSQIKEN